MEKTVTLKPLFHREQECIGIYFENSSVISNAILKYAGAKWSYSKKVWWIPLSKENYEKISLALKGKVIVEKSALREYLLEKKKRNTKALPPATIPLASRAEPVIVKGKKLSFDQALQKQPATSYKNYRIYSINAHVLPAMEQYLKLKAYSVSTIKTYLGEMSQLLQLLKNIPADDLQPEHIRRFLVYCFEKLRLTENTIHSRINAMKFYYEQVLHREKFFWEIPRPKKHLQLPKVLSKEEMIGLLRAIENVKHKSMIMLGYGCGLRVSEITALKLTDLDEDRRLLIVRRGKGKKDRVISLSPALLVVLREYKNKYKPRNYLFEGKQAGSNYSVRSLESIIDAAKRKAGIKKSGSMHMLRHSFATHLLDKGTDVVLIQKLLGHNDIRTTLRYLHVTNKDILNILSPLEDIKDLIG